MGAHEFIQEVFDWSPQGQKQGMSVFTESRKEKNTKIKDSLLFTWLGYLTAGYSGLSLSFHCMCYLYWNSSFALGDRGSNQKLAKMDIPCFFFLLGVLLIPPC